YQSLEQRMIVLRRGRQQAKPRALGPAEQHKSVIGCCAQVSGELSKIGSNLCLRQSAGVRISAEVSLGIQSVHVVAPPAHGLGNRDRKAVPATISGNKQNLSASPPSGRKVIDVLGLAPNGDFVLTW